MSKENAGYLVTTKTGKRGRTYHSKGLVKDKVPVYLCEEEKETKIPGLKVCVRYSAVATLCDKDSVTINGFID